MIWFWYFLVAELLFGGNGHLIEFFGVAIRTWILLLFLLSWFVFTIRQRRNGQQPEAMLVRPRSPRVEAGPRRWWLFLPLTGIALAVGIGIVQGWLNDHDPRAIIQDAIPFAFFLLLSPARHFVTPERYPIYQKFIKAHLLLAATISLITLFLFSSGIAILQDPYYKWFRDTAGGKITDVGNHFFRIVLPEQLLLVPILLFLLAACIRDRGNKRLWVWIAVTLVPLTITLSRTYVFAFAVGLLFLFSRQHRKRWIGVSLASIFLALSLFGAIHVAASRGQSFGFELLIGRLGSIATPHTERSAATRKMLLGPIWEEIQNYPIIGNGLGATISFVDPMSQETVTTRHFDWGYLELWTELGLLGLLSYLSLLSYLILHTSGPARASVAALAVMNLTAPALFHVFGIVILVFLITQINPSSQPAAADYGGVQ